MAFSISSSYMIQWVSASYPTHTPQRWTSCRGCKSWLELMLLQMQWQNLFLWKCRRYLSWAWWRGDPVYSATECSSWRARPRPPLRRCDPPSGSGSDCHPAGKPGHRSLLSHNPTNNNTKLHQHYCSANSLSCYTTCSRPVKLLESKCNQIQAGCDDTCNSPLKECFCVGVFVPSSHF